MSGSCMILTIFVLFGVFTWTEHAHVDASQSSLDTRGRLADLIAIASRVNQKYVAREKRSQGSLYNAGDNFLQNGIAKRHTLWKSGGFQRGLVRRRRQAAFDNFYNEYEQFYGLMTTFLNDLVTKLKPDAPDDLQYLTIIPDILPLDSQDFTGYNEESVLKKGLVVLNIMDLVLQKIGQYVIDSQQSWLTDQSDVLRLYMVLVDAALVNLNLADDYVFEDLSAGIGGMNTDSSTYRPVNKDNLLALVNTLSNSR
ncbi:hypothetical protein PoB_007682000 [Plakobranchus ocellatus]|uniref:Uncharacterized protein n=1 Tax=Plakobranchus ocellatus TaxID=259542 RepID=A0AAV4E1Z7_9GAST|nr:hypothetical protein PoB_007682000 [Plakobranchus ocellatus]